MNTQTKPLIFHTDHQRGSQLTAVCDGELVLAARAGQRACLAELVRRHTRLVRGLIARRLGCDHEYEDLVQECWLAALTSLDTLRDGQAFASWLASLVLRTVSKRLRSRAVRRRHIVCVPSASPGA